METKYFVDENGNYLGAFCGAEPPQGSKEVPTAPDHALDKWINGNWVRHISPPTRQQVLDKIIITTQSGKTFDGDEISQTRIARALQIGAFTGQTSTRWKLADDTVEQVTYVELQEALTLAMIEVGRIVGAIT